VLFAEVPATSTLVAETSSRSAKRDLIAELLGRLDPTEVAVVVSFLVGEPRQGRLGVGWRTLAASATEPAASPTLSVLQVDRVLAELVVLEGSGSGTRRRQLLGELLGRATADEAWFLTRLLGGELRQGASQGVVLDAVAVAAGVPATVVRRAVMLGGRLDEVAALALTGGRAALESVSLELGRPLQPMLASSAPSVSEAIRAIGTASVEWKLDGIRIQVHRRGDDVRVWTRNLNDITQRLPGVVAATRELPADALVLDGEAIGLGADGRPRLFQDTVSVDDGQGGGLRPFFFDLVHVDGQDLIDVELGERRARLRDLAGPWVVPSELTDDPEEGEAVLAASLGAGHEGVVVKAAGSSYEAGRRGKAWRKVKPVHTLDLVVLGVEWGHGRREGWLSNLHLGARADGDGGYVMVGKTFKGLTDELLRWQTARFLDLAGLPVPPSGDAPVGTVVVPPVQVVEVAVDGVQRSTRYPGGVALRFARVLRYREDKDAAQADTISAVRAMLGGAD
jgi:DNA ligase-1